MQAIHLLSIRNSFNIPLNNLPLFKKNLLIPATTLGLHRTNSGVMSDTIKLNGYCIERLGKQNVGDLDKLHRVLYSRRHPAEYFEKKYDTSYTGVQHVGYIAYNEKRDPIAFFGVIPCFIRHEHELHLAAQSADTMTHPNYSFKGLFLHLATMTLELCREEGIVLVFGFPVQSALHSFMVKLKWQMTEMMDCYIVPVSIIPVERIIKKLPFTKRLYHRYQEKVLKDYLVDAHGTENSILKDGFAGVNRNAHYLRYRGYHKTYVIQIGASLLWVKVRNGLVIGDINCNPKDFDDMMEKLQKLALRLGVHRILFHTSHQTQLASMFAERYEAVPSHYVLFKDLGSKIPLDKVKFTYADVDLF
jgi:hypothetical protein